MKKKIIALTVVATLSLSVMAFAETKKINVTIGNLTANGKLVGSWSAWVNGADSGDSYTTIEAKSGVRVGTYIENVDYSGNVQDSGSDTDPTSAHAYSSASGTKAIHSDHTLYDDNNSKSRTLSLSDW